MDKVQSEMPPQVLKAAEGAVPECSICLDDLVVVSFDGRLHPGAGEKPVRSVAMLQCGHQFHLDCIGSAFNAKGSMQCPYCRNIEKGRWLLPGSIPRGIRSSSFSPAADGNGSSSVLGLPHMLAHSGRSEQPAEPSLSTITTITSSSTSPPFRFAPHQFFMERPLASPPRRRL